MPTCNTRTQGLAAHDEPQPLTLLHVGVGNMFGGIETLLVTLARERGHCPTMEPHFALCFEGRLARELRAASVPVTLLGSARFRYPWTIGRVRLSAPEALPCRPS